MQSYKLLDSQEIYPTGTEDTRSVVVFSGVLYLLYNTQLVELSDVSWHVTIYLDGSINTQKIYIKKAVHTHKNLITSLLKFLFI